MIHPYPLQQSTLSLRRWTAFIAVFVFFPLLSVTANATYHIAGHVYDGAGAPITGAKLHLTGTGLNLTTLSASDGSYIFDSLNSLSALTVWAYVPGMVFTPANYTYPEFSQTNRDNQNFTGARTWFIDNAETNVTLNDTMSVKVDGQNRLHAAYVLGSNLMYARWDPVSGIWTKRVVDSGVAAGSLGCGVSMALDAQGNPYFAYRYSSNKNLTFAQWNGSGWGFITVDATYNSGALPSLAIDNTGIAHIAYDSGTGLKYARGLGFNWTIQTVDSNSSLRYKSLALDTSGQAHIAYLSWVTQQYYYSSFNGTVWTNETVSPASPSSLGVSLAIDSSNVPHITFPLNGYIQYATKNGSTWSVENIQSADTGNGSESSIAVDGQGNPMIAFTASLTTTASLYYAKRVQGTWSTTPVEWDGSTTYPVIAADGAGNPHIFYRNYYSSSDNSIRYARKVVPTFAISGVVRQVSGTPVVGATVTVSGAASGFVLTNSVGAYLFPALASATYTIAAVKSRLTMVPEFRTYAPLSSNQTNQDFVGMLGPVVVINQPSAGQQVSGPVTIAGTARDDRGVAYIEVQVDTGTFVLANGSTTWSGSIFTPSYPNGTHTITIQAKDLDGDVSLTTLSLVFKNDLTSNFITISTPTPNQTVSKTVAFLGKAATPGGVEYIRVEVDNAYLTTMQVYSTAPSTIDWSFNWESDDVVSATHTVTFKVQNWQDIFTSSASILLTTKNDIAVYDPVLKAPKCSFGTAMCSSGLSERGRGNMTDTLEPNQPNTILNSCPDAPYGTYHNTDSLDRLRIYTIDGGPFAPGKVVQVDAFAWEAYGLGTYELYYSTKTDATGWSLVKRVINFNSYDQVFSATFTLLNTNGLQAIRGAYRDQITGGTCISINDSDQDDLIFSVGDSLPPVITISTPSNNQLISGRITVKGTASDNVGVALVQVRIDTLAFTTATGTATWTCVRSTFSLTDGTHTITAQATDVNGNISQAQVQIQTRNDFSPPIFSSITVTNITGISALVGWMTNEPSTSQVIYGTTTAYGMSTVFDPTLVLQHAVPVGGLLANTVYHYRIKSQDASGNLFTAINDRTFTTSTADTTPPVFSSVTVTNITERSASVGWMTNEPSTSQVIYGTTTAYGMSTVFDPTLVLQHAVPIGGLLANTVYHYRMKSQDAAGNLMTAINDRTFTTLTVDTTPPTVFITTPTNGQSVSGVVVIRGTAFDNRFLTRVDIQVDSGSWLLATGTAAWSFSWDTASVSAGTHIVTARATDRSGNTGNATVSVVVIPPVGPAQANYSGSYKAPQCALASSSCDSAGLLVGRGLMISGAEPNQPNTLFNSCSDSNSGTFHVDESNDRIVISSLDGAALTVGKSVRIDATVWAYASYSSDYLDLYYTPSADSPQWTYLTTISPTKAGSQVLSATYTLPTGPTQAVRAVYRYSGSPNICISAAYRDNDDLVFNVQPAGSAQVTTAALTSTPSEKNSTSNQVVEPPTDVYAYPNPVRNGAPLKIHVGDVDARLRLFDAAGGEVHASFMNQGGEYVLGTSSLASGVYTYRVFFGHDDRAVVKGSFMVVK